MSLTARTRHFVVASLLVLLAGIGAGLAAYYMRVPLGVFQSGEPQDLRYVPEDAALVAYANVHDVMASEIRQRIRRAVPMPENGQRQFQNETGINIETDIDRVLAYLGPASAGGSGANADARPSGGLVLARGRFDEVKIETLMRDHGASVEEYNGIRLIANPAAAGPMGDGFALAFIEPGLAAVGSTPMVRAVIDRMTGGSNVTANEELMSQIRALDDGTAWAVGRFDELGANARLPQQIASQIPPITWFSLSSRIGTYLRGTVRADTRDEAAAANLRDVVRGFVALAKLQAGSRPEFQAVVQSLELGGSDKTVTLSFSVSGEVFDAIGAAARPPQR